MSLVKGENAIGYIYDAGQWKLFICARDISMSIDTEVIETTVTGSGNYKTFEPTVHAAKVSLSGVVSLNESGVLTLADLHALQLAKTKLYFRYTMTSQDGDTYRREFYAYIVNSIDTGSFDGVATFQMELQVSGSITQVFTPPSPTTGTVYRYPAAGSSAPVAAGTYTVNIPSLVNKTILGVWKDGVGNNDIITAGTPVGKEVLYDSSTGDFTWAVPFDGETFFILYQNV